ncbi:MAG: hypothetical protein LBS55_07350 [Prevotellaceae bacterium]|nr:hypothetical protein [Prevotellaceae bacterium]
MALSKPVPIGSIDRNLDAISLSLCNEILTNIVGSHIGLVVHPYFFLLPVELIISDENNENKIRFILNERMEQDFISALYKYNQNVRNNIKDAVDINDYYVPKHQGINSGISKFTLEYPSISKSCKVLEVSYNINLTFKIYDRNNNKTIEYYNHNFIELKKEQKNAVKTYLENVCLQSAYNLEHRRYHILMENIATRAAVSQVMVRNLSHNIGSHTFSNLIENNIYTNLANKITTDPITYKSDIIDNLDKDNQLAYFNQYLKSRMDYLSEVTFGVSNTLTTKRFYNDVFLELDRVRLLLNYISGISDFKYRFVLKYNDKKLTKDNDISMAFPSDVLGCQAFYNIIENIIRNTAKHTNKSNQPIKEFTIHFKDIQNIPENNDNFQQYYQVEIDDGIALKEIEMCTKTDKELIDFIKASNTFASKWDELQDDDGNTISLTSKIEIPKIECLVIRQNSRLNNSIIDKDNKLRNHSLGLLEMEASAAFLRQIDIPEIESEKYNLFANEEYYNNHHDSVTGTEHQLNIIKAFKTENNALGYRFFIKKPQEFLFVGDWGIGVKTKTKLMNQGIWFKSEDGLKEDLRKGTAFAHRFVISTEPEDEFFTGKSKSEEQKLKDKTLLPNKWVCVKDNIDAIRGVLNKSDFDILKLEAKIWEIFYGIDFKMHLNNDFKDNTNVDLIEYQIELSHHITNQENRFQQFADKKETNISIKTYGEPLSSYGISKLPFIYNNGIASYVNKVNNDDDNATFDENNKGKRNEIACITKSILWDCYSTGILVVDERIKEYSESVYFGAERITRKTVFSTANVIITDNKLSANVLDSNLINNIDVEIDTYQPAFILIHYGILERFYGNNKDKIDDCLKKWVVEKNCNVVVTSGRGKHSLKLPEYVRYLNLSSVLYAFVENQNKYSMNYIVNQARR